MRTHILILGILAFLADPALAGWKFVVFGDTRGDYKKYPPSDPWTAYPDGGVNTAVLADMAAAIGGEDADFAVMLGDMVSKWTKVLKGDPARPETGVRAADLIDAELDLWITTWNDHSGSLPILPIRGNHEATLDTFKATDQWAPSTPEDLAAVWRAHFPMLPQNGPAGAVGLTYSLKYKDIFFVALDPYPAGDVPQFSPEVLAWLQAQLAGSDALEEFVFGHAPAFPSTDPALPKVPNALPCPNSNLAELIAGTYLPARDAFWNVLGSQGCQVFFTAHEHLYARAWAQDSFGNVVRQMIVGAGGAPLDPAPQLLYVDNWDLATWDPLYPKVLPQPLPDPRVFAEAGDVARTFGYLVVEVDGPKVYTTYKAMVGGVGEGYEVIDTWGYRVHGVEE